MACANLCVCVGWVGRDVSADVASIFRVQGTDGILENIRASFLRLYAHRRVHFVVTSAVITK